MASFDYLDQSIRASCLIQPHDIDSFYNPSLNNHTGYASNGNYYESGVLQMGHPTASWFNEAFNVYRGGSAVFPTYGLILLSSVSLVILNEAIPTPDPTALQLWMQFILADNLALPNNWNGGTNGWNPASLTYADGIISVTYFPDEGNQTGGSPLSINSNMVVSIDFTTDQVYTDVAT